MNESRSLISQQEHDDLLKKIRRALLTLSECSQSMIRIDDELELLQSICTHIATAGCYRMAWAGYAWRDKNKRIEPVAKAGYVDGYLDGLITWADEPAGNHPAGIAIRNKNIYICRDISMAVDPHLSQPAALQHGYAAVIAMPLMVAEEAIGALVIYAAEKGSFDQDETSLLNCLAENLGYAIQAIRVRREHDQALKLIMESKERFQSLYDTSPLLLLTVDEECMILSVNRYGAHLLGYQIHEITGTSLLELIHGKSRDKEADLIKKCFKQPGHAHQLELRMISKDGEILFLKQTANLVVNSHGVSDVLIACVDVTEEHKLSRELNFQAAHDALTGLANRYEFERRLQRLLASSEGDDTHALCYLDLDQFKLINDTCGHVAGDELLRQLSGMFSSKLRKLDTIARLGGDEFGVLMEYCTLEHAQRVANDLRELIHDYRFLWGDHRFSLGASIGLVPINKEAGTISDVMSAADAACYAAKEAGRNRIHIYHHDDEKVLKRQGEVQWINRINQAMDQNRFRLYCQPIVELGKEYKNRDEHYEILVRIEADDGKIITPGMFLPAAEKYNLAAKIDQWVIRNALQWLVHDPKRNANIQLLSINLSGQSISQPEFMNFLLNELQNELLDPEKICFEITETAAISDLASAIRFMYEVKGFGCSFALDDFGSGLSSLNYLKNLPVDYLKIDGAFVRDIVHDRIDFTLVKSISEIGQVMGKLTIAEFVENEDTLNSLIRIGINFGQGYHIGKPAPIRS